MTASLMSRLAHVAALALLTLPAAAEPPPLPEDISDYRHVHSFAITDKDNPLFGFHHFYADPKALNALPKGGPYPDGAVFLGMVYQVKTDGAQVNEGEGVAYTLMVKDADAEATGGWRFAQYLADGSYVEQDEASACFQCHTQVADRDYVFTRPLEPLKLPRP